MACGSVLIRPTGGSVHVGRGHQLCNQNSWIGIPAPLLELSEALQGSSSI